MKIPQLFTLIVFLFYFTSIFGQRNAYPELKQIYHGRDFRLLKEKPIYNPIQAAIKSLILPGLGQYMLDEPKLGSKDLTCVLIADGTALISMGYLATRYFHSKNYTTTQNSEDEFVLYVLSVIYLNSWPVFSMGLRLLSALNALQIAQIKSVAYEDKNNNSLSLKLLPDIRYHSFDTTTRSMVYGLNMTLTF